PGPHTRREPHPASAHGAEVFRLPGAHCPWCGRGEVVTCCPGGRRCTGRPRDANRHDGCSDESTAGEPIGSDSTVLTRRWQMAAKKRGGGRGRRGVAKANPTGKSWPRSTRKAPRVPSPRESIEIF